MLYLSLSWNAQKKSIFAAVSGIDSADIVALFTDFLKPVEYHQVLLVFGAHLFALYQTSSNDAWGQGHFSELVL